MADSGSRKLFRKKSLERLSSPERLDQLLEVVKPRNWIPLITLAVLIFGVLVWSVIARIPVNVEGKGILVHPRRVVEFQAPAAGRLLRLEVETDDIVKRGDILAVLARPDLDERLRLLKHKHAELTEQIEVADLLVTDGPPEELPGAAPGEPSLRDHVELSRMAAQRLYDQRVEAITKDHLRLEEQKGIAIELRDSLKKRVANHRRLYVEDLVSRVELDDVEGEYAESLERLYAIETQRGALRTSRLEAEQALYDRLQRIAEWKFDLQQDIADVAREISELERKLHEETHVFSEHNGRILELSGSPGTFLSGGERLGACEIDDSESSLRSVTYFLVKDGKRLRVGMRIRITPDTVERERYGSIEGAILSVSHFPVTLEEAANVVGNRLVAESLLQGGYLIQVSAELMRSPARPDHYDWTSSKGEDVEVSAGTMTTARVAIESDRPIDLVFPLIKSAAGIE